MKHFTFLFAMLLAFGANAQLVDGSFEAGAGTGVWGETSTNFGSPLCTEAFCGTCGGDCAAFDGDWYAWFGGATADEVGSVTQTVNIPSGNTATLSFYFDIASPGAGLAEDGVAVFVDGDALWSAAATDSSAYDGYTQVNIDISAYADGGNHSIGIFGYQTTEVPSNFLVDLISMTVDGNDATNVNDILNNEKAITVFPNPANEVVNFKFGAAAQGDAVVRLYNLAGEIVIENNLSDVFNRTFTLETADLQDGLYLIEVNVNGEKFTQRVIVQK
ncbi:T9SS type A sorting domain-containing protein [Sanyastnella coralliicola]|uniref:T9SS type A sorting domain-containing protein n=1 Tax=Sanyastnella coralliicola TaxID=3069118 RepID=UPI0027BA9FB6|nr:T9SS type A sorting domain-containing protein [Longitalea sp. SCSIO 12813]